MSAGGETPGAAPAVQAEWARLLLASFADAGVQDVVVCPGSRSTPFVLAAAAERRLRLWSIVDERAAAFFALGQARVAGRPSLLICTSGSAGAHFWPAVVEAAVAEVPLLILTADRPIELQAAGANQTIDQLKLFGDYARLFLDLGTADADPGALLGARRLVAQAAATACSPKPGPVHLNARARPPLEPPAGISLELRAGVEATLGRPIARRHAPCRMPSTVALDDLAAALARAERPLLVAGPAPLAAGIDIEALWALAERIDAPLLADSTSQARFGAGRCARTLDAGSALLAQRTFLEGKGPDLVIQIGRAPTTSQWSKYLSRHLGGIEAYWILAEHGWPDADNLATDLLIADRAATLEELAARLPCRPGERPWTGRWLAAAAIAEATIAELLAGGETLSEAWVARRLAEKLPKNALLQVGNSLAIRELDLFSRGSRPRLGVLSQRGASGIDGQLAGALGAACLADRVTAVLLGDLSLHHDLNALALPSGDAAFVAVVVNNDGGRIFEHLPLAKTPLGKEPAFDLWTTPQHRQFAAAAAHFAWSYAATESREGFDHALAAALAGGRTLIEVLVPPRGTVDDNEALRARLAAKLAELP